MIQITDHASRALALLAEQLKNQPNAAAWINAFAAEVQAIENALWDLYTKRALATATGVQLDGIGRIVKQSRNGTADAQYRILLGAKIAANRASGTIPEILNLLTAITGLSVVLTEYTIDAFVARLVGAITASSAATVLQAFRSTKAADVKAILEWSVVATASTFSMQSGPGLGFGDSGNPATGGAFAGASE